MVLFEIVGRKRNATITPGNLDWFPRHVWDKFKKGELEEMSCVCGIKELKESASRMCEMVVRSRLPQRSAANECSGEDARGRSRNNAATKSIPILESISDREHKTEFATN